MPCTLTSASWLTMVEHFFGDTTTEWLRQGESTSIPVLITPIDHSIDHHNTKPEPIIWTKNARDVLQQVIRANGRLRRSKQNATLQ